MTVLRDCILWGIETCSNALELNLWWREHQTALKALRRLDPDGFAAALAAKERVKARPQPRMFEAEAPELAPPHPQWMDEGTADEE